GGGVAYIVGVQGVLLKTSDSGATWTKQTTNTTHDLEAVWGSSATDVWAAGVKGTLLHTTDGGTTWQAVSTTTSDVYDVWGANANDVYIVGGGGMVKHYNGSTWASVNVSAGQTVLNCVWGASGSDVYLFGANGLGLRGSAAAGFGKLGSPTSDVLFYGWGSPGATDIWVPSNNAPSFTSASLWHSSDHGATWQSQMSTVVLGAVWANNSGHAFVVGNEIFETTDSGAHWNSVSGAPAALFGIGGDANGTAVWAVGQSGTILYRP
ncbi:MAG TPA: YCF48-related protein, partial [Polyangia bacterium]